MRERKEEAEERKISLFLIHPFPLQTRSHDYVVIVRASARKGYSNSYCQAIYNKCTITWTRVVSRSEIKLSIIELHATSVLVLSGRKGYKRVSGRHKNKNIAQSSQATKVCRRSRLADKSHGSFHPEWMCVVKIFLPQHIFHF